MLSFSMMIVMAISMMILAILSFHSPNIWLRSDQKYKVSPYKKLLQENGCLDRGQCKVSHYMRETPLFKDKSQNKEHMVETIGKIISLHGEPFSTASQL